MEILFFILIFLFTVLFCCLANAINCIVLNLINGGIIMIFELIGTVAFAISGALVAIENEMDIFGVAILGMTTAVGGGIVRDVLIGNTPPVAFKEPLFALVSIIISVIVFIPQIRKVIKRRSDDVLAIMDTIGLAVFTVVGVKAGMSYSNVFLAVFVGVVTGVGGGVMRDLFAGDKPYIFVKHFYACASLSGAIVSVALWSANEKLAMITGAVVVGILRILAKKYCWSLPKAKKGD